MDYTQEQLLDICRRFDIREEVTEVRGVGEGFINDTFIAMGGDGPAYILQRKNRHIFTDPPAMMQNIALVTAHLKAKIRAAGGDPMRESLTVTPLKNGTLCYRDPQGEYWAMCDFIRDTVTHQAADTLALVRQGGFGIGRFQAMLSDFTAPLADILPGFHDMRFRLRQWDEVLAKDPAGRKREMAAEIAQIEARRAGVMHLWELYEQGAIPRRVTHNDTKISNFLFDSDDNVVCVIDLDTVLGSMCLNDYGDAIRSYANTSTEDDPDLGRVGFDMQRFETYTEGYLEGTGGFLTPVELDNLAFSALYITYEQALRFLMDYLDGDRYYKIKSPDHNRVRTRAQLHLLQSMERQYPAMCEAVRRAAEKQ